MSDKETVATLRRAYRPITALCLIFTAFSAVVFAAHGGWIMAVVLTVACAFFGYALNRGVRDAE